MSITFDCGQCGKSFTVDGKFAGKTGRCKQCGATMTIPSGAAPPEDVFGLEEPVLPPRASAPPAPIKPAADPLAPPSRAKAKKKGAMGVVGTAFKLVAAAFGALIALGFAINLLSNVVPGLRQVTTPGFKTKAALESMLQKQVALHEELAAIFAPIQDAEQAKATSPRAVAQIDKITANLIELRSTKALQTDIDALKAQYSGVQTAAVQKMLAQVMRVAAIPEAWDALAVQKAFEKMEAVENSIPGLQQVGLPDAPAPEAAGQPTPAPGPAPRKSGPRNAGLISKKALEDLLKKRVALHDDLAKIMGDVEDADQAKRNSSQAVRKLRQITTNLRQLKGAKAAQADLDSLGTTYGPLQQEAVAKVATERERLEVLPEIWQAFGIQAAFTELGVEESGLPGANGDASNDAPAPEAKAEDRSGPNPDQARNIANDRARRRARPGLPPGPNPR